MKFDQTMLSKRGYPLAVNRGQSPSLDSAIEKGSSSDGVRAAAPVDNLSRACPYMLKYCEK
jgi:hypothetical protein